MYNSKALQFSIRLAGKLALGIAIGFFMTFILDGFNIFSFSWRDVKITIIVSSIIGLLMWQGNKYIQIYLRRKYPWDVNPVKAFRWNILVSSIYNTIAVFIIYSLLAYYFSGGHFDFSKQLERIVINSTIISLLSFFVWMIMFLVKFFKGYKENIKKEEQHKRDIAVYQYEMLKNQVNPHFLFNSLNVLTSLIETDSEAAVKFTRKLADVYRYVLDAKDKETVPLSEEIRLTESYIFMQQHRFGSNLIVNIENLPLQKHIVPLSLQMLVENAIKHNVITSEAPLTISIYEKEGCLVCENNLQKKPVLADSNTIGLKNIKERYAFLSEKPMMYTETGGKFMVMLPLI
jgi:sensor histidine kinase YesM